MNVKEASGWWTEGSKINQRSTLLDEKGGLTTNHGGQGKTPGAKERKKKEVADDSIHDSVGVHNNVKVAESEGVD